MNKGNLIEVIGDVTTPQRVEENEIVVIPHVCNDIGKMGAGIALAIKRKWEGAFNIYAGHIARVGQGEKNLGSTGFWDSNDNGVYDNVIVCNMIAQHNFIGSNNSRPLNYGALAKCMNDVAERIIRERYNCFFNEIRIHTGKFGSDLAGGDWNIISEMIDYLWLNKGIDVVIYEYVG